MNPKDKLCADCWRRGTEAMQKQNWDYAIEMFTTCVNIKPENLVYRQTLRGCEQKKYDNNKSGAGGLAKAKLMGIRGRIKKARSKEEWEDLDKAAEEGLKVNPWDTGLNADMAEAAQKREFMEVAEFGYYTAFQADPKNKANAVQYANILQERAKYNEAVKMWEHVCKLDPTDVAAQRKITQLQTMETTVRGGFEEAETTQDVRVKASGPAGRPGETVAPGQSEETDLKHAIRREPDRIEHYQKLAAWYRSNKRLDDAYDTLKTALEMSGNDVAYREQLEDVELDMLRRNRDLAREASQGNGDDATARKNWEELEKELVKRELEVFLSREQRYPQDTRLKMEIAQRFMRFNKWAEAIPRLQKAAQDTRLSGKGFALLGMCFYKDGKLALAKGQLERALPSLNHDRDPKLFKDSHYNLARILEEMGDAAKAEEHYGEILVVDYDYRDARQRLERLQAGGGGE
jgi:tetratricopeptide (TPR) repeat protein